MNKKDIQQTLSLGHLLLGREVAPPARRSAGFHSLAHSTGQSSSKRSSTGAPSNGTPFFAAARDTKKKELPHLSYQQIASHLQTEDRCRSSILATATQHFGYTYGVEPDEDDPEPPLPGLSA